MKNVKILLGILLVLAISAAIALAGGQASVPYGNISLFVACASIGFILHWLVFLPSFALQTEHYFDLTGSLSYIATIAFALTANPDFGARGMLIGLLVVLWAVRLGSFLFLRVTRDGRDRRFDEIKTRFLRFLFTWTLGGAWVFLTLAAGLAAITSTGAPALDAFALIGGIMWLAGFAIEVIADRQKSAFRAQPQNKGKFITSGLWAYSRHPNYAGEILLWIGIAVIATPALSGWQYVTLISPVFVTFLLVRVSGVPMLEKSAADRWGDDPEYQRYVATVPVLLPRLGRAD